MGLRDWWRRTFEKPSTPTVPAGATQAEGVGPPDSIVAESENGDDFINMDGTVKP